VAELRSFIFLSRLQPQTMCYLGTWVRGRLPRAGLAAQVIEVAPGLDIEPLTDVAIKEADVQAGILVVERLIPDTPADAVPALLSDINMLVLTGGRERTNAEYASLLRAAGLRPGPVRPVAFPYGIIEARRPDAR